MPTSAPAADTAAFDELRARARELASRDFEPPDSRDLPEWLARMDYDAYRRIRFRLDTALWTAEELPFRALFLHRGYIFPDRVRMDELVDGDWRELEFSPGQFSYDDGQPAPEGLGYSGLALLHRTASTGRWDEIAAFQGASYFRLLGEAQVYGACFRGVAVDTAEPAGEDFPRFRELRLVRPAAGDDRIVLHALLDSPALTGAFRLAIRPGATASAEVSAVLFPRHEIGKLGLAPLTSMFLHGEDLPARAPDWRPEVHDSDGLLVEGRDGSWLWRPLGNPARVHRVTRLGAGTPAGFGLLQRDRELGSYEDLEARFERRPSLWVTPRGDWGAGSLELVEIPTDAEWNDNIVAFWVPEQRPSRGQEIALQYELQATTDDPSPRARVRATRVRPGSGPTLFVVDFDDPGGGGELTADVTASRGGIQAAVLRPDEARGGWRCSFELVAEGDDPVDVRVTLRRGEEDASETLLYRWARP